MGTYYELRIKINPDISDIIANLCFENFVCEGVVLAEEAYNDDKMVSTTEGILKVFLRVLPDVRKVLEKQRTILKSRGLTDFELGSWDFEIIENEDEDWSKKWKENWGITKVTEKIVVVPDWLEYKEKPNEVIIRLEPGCAFGTGTHATTQLCMKAIQKYLNKNDSVADIGTGSGILAICAKKFGASFVYGCDNDETVIDVARENALKNSVECVFELNTADKINKKFDFVTANILHNVLADIMGDLKNIMNDNAKLVLSGILNEKRKIVLDAIKLQSLKCIEEIHQDEWVSFIVEKI